MGVFHVKIVLGVLVKYLKNWFRSYKATLFSGVMLGFVSIHTLEDIALMSIGRFVPFPLLAMYAIGLIISWLLMGCIVNGLYKKLGKEPHHH